MGGCVTKYRELDLTADSFSESLQPGQVKFYGLTITREWLEKKMDLVVRVHVEKGRLNGVYCSRDRAFPNQKRKIWSTERYCACPNPTCDHCYPHCLNEHGGLCIECMVHDEKWDRMSHDVALGGMGNDPGKAGVPSSDLAAEIAEAGAAENEVLEPPYQHHSEYEFSLRLSPGLEKHLLAPGHFFLTIEAAPEIVSRALRKQRRLEGEEEYHTTTYSLWLDERPPKGKPQLGNEARVAEASARLKERLERAELKREFGRKIDDQERKKKEQKQEEEKLREIGLNLGEDELPKQKKSVALHLEAEEMEEKKGSA